MAVRGYSDGIPVTLHFVLANVPTSATTAMTLPAGGAGFEVPTGYSFYPQILSFISNADLTAGSWTAKVTTDGTVIANGPEPVLNDTVQLATAEVNPLAAQKIVAGNYVGVKIVADASAAPTTAEADVIVIGRLIAEPS